MANCAKCSAELIGSARFCATCGTPVAPPSSEAGYAPPVSQVNPFASTASPVSKKPRSAPPPPPSLAGPSVEAMPPTWESGTTPPGKSPSTPAPGPDAPQVSPLAVSGALSQRGAFQQAVESAMDKARASVTPPPAPVRAKPGTQLMQHAPNRALPPLGKPGDGNVPQQPAHEAAPAKKAAPRTVAMNFASKPPTPPPGGPNSAAPNTTPSAGGVMYPLSGAAGQPHVAQPQPGGPASHVQHAPPGAPYPQPYPQQAPYGQQPAPSATPGGWGWNPAAAPPVQPQQAPGAYPYPFGYSPGSRVHVTWSNGQRYPATVSQVSGSKCLVVFPDGQQHWVEMMYLSPSTP